MFTPRVMILMSRVSHMWPMFPMLFTLRGGFSQDVRRSRGVVSSGVQPEFGGLGPANDSARALHGGAVGPEGRSSDRG